MEWSDTEADDTEAIEEEEELNLRPGELFCRFTPSQIDRMASQLLGEAPLCERWISKCGKYALLYPLRIKYRKTPGISGREFGERVDLKQLWEQTITPGKR